MFFPDLLKFPNKRIRTLEALDCSAKPGQNTRSKNSSCQGLKNSISNPSQIVKPKLHNVNKLSFIKCFFCSGQHTIYRCESFRKKSVQERLDFVRASKMCFNCLAKHAVKDCKSQKVC